MELLRFLWGICHHDMVIATPNIGNLQDEDTVARSNSTQRTIAPKVMAPSTTTNLSTLSRADSQAMLAGAMKLMTKLLESMTRYQDSAAKVQEVKADSRLKVWNKLLRIQQHILFLAGADSNVVVSKEPIEEMLAILGCLN